MTPTASDLLSTFRVRAYNAVTDHEEHLRVHALTVHGAFLAATAKLEAWALHWTEIEVSDADGRQCALYDQM